MKYLDFMHLMTLDRYDIYVDLYDRVVVCTTCGTSYTSTNRYAA